MSPPTIIGSAHFLSASRASLWGVWGERNRDTPAICSWNAARSRFRSRSHFTFYLCGLLYRADIITILSIIQAAGIDGLLGWSGPQRSIAQAPGVWFGHRPAARRVNPAAWRQATQCNLSRNSSQRAKFARNCSTANTASDRLSLFICIPIWMCCHDRCVLIIVLYSWRGAYFRYCCALFVFVLVLEVDLDVDMVLVLVQALPGQNLLSMLLFNSLLLQSIRGEHDPLFNDSLFTFSTLFLPPTSISPKLSQLCILFP